MRLSYSVNAGARAFAPGSITLLCGSFKGSEKETQNAVFTSIGSEKSWSKLSRVIFEDELGG
jgi:hypothetical protein